MNINIRQSIISNFNGANKNEIKASIISSINDKEEIILPGLGVFFEILWNNANEDLKESILSIIEENIKRNQI